MSSAVSKASELLLREGFDHDVVDIFCRNKITLTLMKDLDVDDFKELGIDALGDRKRLKNLIAKLQSRDSHNVNTTSGQSNMVRTLTKLHDDLIVNLCTKIILFLDDALDFDVYFFTFGG